MNVIRPLPSNHWSHITPRPPDKVMLYSFDHYSISKTTQPYQILCDRLKAHSLFFVEMFETCYILKNSWMYILQITLFLFQFVFKIAHVSLFGICKKCDIERK